MRWWRNSHFLAPRWMCAGQAKPKFRGYRLPFRWREPTQQ
jgi:hypothetical protein